MLSKMGVYEDSAPQTSLVGCTGTGKTSRFKAWCREKGYNYFVLLASEQGTRQIGGSMGYDLMMRVSIQIP